MVPAPARRTKRRVVYPLLSAEFIRLIYTDLRKRTFLARAFDTPIRLITKIKACESIEQAVELYGNNDA